MESEWRDCELGDVVELKRGYDLPKSKRNKGQIPIISSSGISDVHSEFKVKGPGVVTGRYGTIGKVFFSGENFWPLNTTLYVRDFKGNDPSFIYYFLKTLPYKQYIDKAAVPGINRNHIHKAKVRVPSSLEAQKYIAHHLGTIDQKIDLNHQTNQTLEKMAQALFKSWFVDFDPVIDNALATGTNISDFPESLQKRAELRKTVQQSADAKKLPEDIRKLFPSEFEESDLGWVPKGWEVKVLSDLLEVKYGKDHKKLNDGEYPVYGSGGVMRYAEQYLYSGESVLIPRKGTLSNIIYLNQKFWTVDTMFYTIPQITNIAKFAYYHLKTLDFLSMNVGSAVPSMTTKVLNILNVVTPTEALLEKFDDILTSQFNKIGSNEKESKYLMKLRDTLLPKLISGEIIINKEVA